MSSFASVQIIVNEKLFIRNPELIELGRNIVKYRISLVERIGFEQFTFKKLAVEMGSMEASIYRYFEKEAQTAFWTTNLCVEK